MKRLNILAAAASAALLLSSCAKKEARLKATFPEDFNDREVELLAFQDSVVIARDTIRDGKAEFLTVESDSLKFPMLASLNVDGRVRAFYIIEPGEATLVTDSMRVAKGTPLNERLESFMLQLDSVEALDDMNLYTAFAERVYNAESQNPIGGYFGIEYLKFADPAKIDSLIAKAPESFRNSRRTKHYLGFARLRAATSPGRPYADLDGEDAAGHPLMLSRYVEAGKYTLVDFMASWCPYCIKDMPRLKDLKEKYAAKGLNLVSVAVRDTPADTRTAVEKHGITWPVVYNTGKRPYDIYGFAGIPHYILIGPDGKIIARSEMLSVATSALDKALK